MGDPILGRRGTPQRRGDSPGSPPRLPARRSGPPPPPPASGARQPLPVWKSETRVAMLPPALVALSKAGGRAPPPSSPAGRTPSVRGAPPAPPPPPRGSAGGRRSLRAGPAVGLPSQSSHFSQFPQPFPQPCFSQPFSAPCAPSAQPCSHGPCAGARPEAGACGAALLQPGQPLPGPHPPLPPSPHRLRHPPGAAAGSLASCSPSWGCSPGCAAPASCPVAASEGRRPESGDSHTGRGAPRQGDSAQGRRPRALLRGHGAVGVAPCADALGARLWRGLRVEGLACTTKHVEARSATRKAQSLLHTPARVVEMNHNATRPARSPWSGQPAAGALAPGQPPGASKGVVPSPPPTRRAPHPRRAAANPPACASRRQEVAQVAPGTHLATQHGGDQ